MNETSRKLARKLEKIYKLIAFLPSLIVSQNTRFLYMTAPQTVPAIRTRGTFGVVTSDR
jgi:hypothetical protein